LIFGWLTALTCGFFGFDQEVCALIRDHRVAGAPYVRTVKTASGAEAVQLVYSSHRGRRRSSTSDRRTTMPSPSGRSRSSTWPPGMASSILAQASASRALPVSSSRMGHLLDALTHDPLQEQSGYASETGTIFLPR
jgi:hypothetical protein